MFPTYAMENKLIEKGFCKVAGVDESGRGTGSGPVVAASVCIPKGEVKYFEGKVKDSKKLSEKKREALYEDIVNRCTFGISISDNNVIDELNILEATKVTMRRSLIELGDFDFVLIDGNFGLRNLDIPQRCIVRGDNTVLSIAAASILAKVHRDRIMYKLHEEYPIYKWNKNKGYLTKEHREAIVTYGSCVYHRQSFKLS